MKCILYDYEGNIVYKTDNVEKMNDFLQNDGSDYDVMSIINFKNNIRIDFKSGLQLFLITENKM